MSEVLSAMFLSSAGLNILLPFKSKSKQQSIVKSVNLFEAYCATFQ